MASPNIYPGGAGGSSGDELATFGNLALSGNVWYVSSLTGTDAVSPAGQDRIKPLRTLAQAHTNAAAGDAIILLSGHNEALSSSQAFSKAGIRLISEGASGTASAARFTCNGAVAMFNITAAGVWICGVYFPASTVAASPARVQVASTASVIRGCYFECGATDTVPSVVYGSSSGTGTIRSCTFISTATVVTAQPSAGVSVSNLMTDLVLDSVTFDGGTAGWSTGLAFSSTAAITRLTATNIDLLRDSDFQVGITGSIYTIHVRSKSSSARLLLTA